MSPGFPQAPSGVGVPLGLEGVLAPQRHLALGGHQQAGQARVEGQRLHHALAHGQAERQRTLGGHRGSGGVGGIPKIPPPGPSLTSTRFQK